MQPRVVIILLKLNIKSHERAPTARDSRIERRGLAPPNILYVVRYQLHDNNHSNCFTQHNGAASLRSAPPGPEVFTNDLARAAARGPPRIRLPLLNILSRLPQSTPRPPRPPPQVLRAQVLPVLPVQRPPRRPKVLALLPPLRCYQVLNRPAHRRRHDDRLLQPGILPEASTRACSLRSFDGPYRSRQRTGQCREGFRHGEPTMYAEPYRRDCQPATILREARSEEEEAKELPVEGEVQEGIPCYGCEGAGVGQAGMVICPWS